MNPHFSIHPSVILWLSILYYLSPEIVFPFLLASAVHETGHYMMLWKLKKPPLSLTLTFSGAVMETPALGYKEELLAALAGPGVSLISAASLPLFPTFGLYSLILGLVNLLPVPGLDGEKILKNLLCLHLSPEKSSTLCAFTAVLAALILFFGSLILSQRDSMGWWPVALTAVFLLRAMNHAFYRK